MNVESYQMVCAYCGVMRNYPEDFPNRLYAECRICIYSRSKKKKMRKGWFKKAKKKFVKKRIYRWEINSYGSEPKLQMGHSGCSTLIHEDRDERYQILEHAQDLGFIKGFWYGRKLDKGMEGWGLHFDKRVNLEEGGKMTQGERR